MPPLTPEEQAAMLRAFIGTGSGSNQINDLENLFGFSQNLLAQAAIGVPGVDAQYISDVVQDLAYTPYDGPDPLAIQEQVNESMRRVASRLGIQPETVNAIAESVIAGTPPDVALSAVSGLVFRDAEGNPRLDVSDAERQEFDALENILQSYQDAVEQERNTFEWDGQRYVARDEAAVRADMEELGLTGQFNDPNVWLFQPDQALLAASQETEEQARQAGAGVADFRSQLEQLERSTRVPVVGGSTLGEDPNVTAGIVKFFEDMQKVDSEPYERMREQGLETGSGTSFIDLAGAATPGEPLSSALDNAPALQATSAENKLLERQQEEAIKAANRYATFAAADQARTQAAPEIAGLRQQITGAVAEENMLQTAAKMQAKEAAAAGSIPGAEQLETFRDYLANSFPSVPSGGGGGRQRYRLSQDQIRSVARAAAGPLRRGAQ